MASCSNTLLLPHLCFATLLCTSPSIHYLSQHPMCLSHYPSWSAISNADTREAAQIVLSPASSTQLMQCSCLTATRLGALRPQILYISSPKIHYGRLHSYYT
ncbi:hypothetical protein CY34DRAFT_713355 [Suillus luteus UH-Slu-Lm8-n1]|uniref:Secreted protein n=1 Tax=Suillus luteus UH-Slu-Lm8-n1 TaxID=930992 RepID=A0A0C9ZVG2_9AGAM|nr:hypothetical protein CY34DRAFT_713355 [Suillus luteus UH-Slu-Lm8-n1]